MNFHREKKIERQEPRRDGKILSDHRQGANNVALGGIDKVAR